MKLELKEMLSFVKAGLGNLLNSHKTKIVYLFVITLLYLTFSCEKEDDGFDEENKIAKISSSIDSLSTEISGSSNYLMSLDTNSDITSELITLTNTIENYEIIISEIESEIDKLNEKKEVVFKLDNVKSILLNLEDDLSAIILKNTSFFREQIEINQNAVKDSIIVAINSRVLFNTAIKDLKEHIEEKTIEEILESTKRLESNYEELINTVQKLQIQSSNDTLYIAKYDFVDENNLVDLITLNLDSLLDLEAQLHLDKIILDEIQGQLDDDSDFLKEIYYNRVDSLITVVTKFNILRDSINDKILERQLLIDSTDDLDGLKSEVVDVQSFVGGTLATLESEIIDSFKLIIVEGDKLVEIFNLDEDLKVKNSQFNTNYISFEENNAVEMLSEKIINNYNLIILRQFDIKLSKIEASITVLDSTLESIVSEIIELEKKFDNQEDIRDSVSSVSERIDNLNYEVLKEELAELKDEANTLDSGDTKTNILGNISNLESLISDSETEITKVRNNIKVLLEKLIPEMTLDEWIISGYEQNVIVHFNETSIPIEGTENFKKFVSALESVEFIVSDGFNANIKIVPNNAIITADQFIKIYNSKLCKDIGVNLSGWTNCTYSGLTPNYDIMNELFQLEEEAWDYDENAQIGNNCDEMIFNFLDTNGQKVSIDFKVVNVLFYTFGFTRGSDERLKITNFDLNGIFRIRSDKYLISDDSSLSLTEAFEFIGEENIDYTITKIEFSSLYCIQVFSELYRLESELGLERSRIKELVDNGNITVYYDSNFADNFNIADAIDEDGNLMFWTEDVMKMIGENPNSRISVEGNILEGHPRSGELIKITEETFNKVVALNKGGITYLTKVLLSADELVLEDGKGWYFEGSILDISRLTFLNNSYSAGGTDSFAVILTHKLETLVGCYKFINTTFLGASPKKIDSGGYDRSTIFAEESLSFRGEYLPESYNLSIKVPIREEALKDWIRLYKNSSIPH